jgi:hypothetical protein
LLQLADLLGIARATSGSTAMEGTPRSIKRMLDATTSVAASRLLSIEETSNGAVAGERLVNAV